MKRLLFSISYYAPHLSGLTLAVQHLAENLAAKGDTIAVLTTQFKKTLPQTETINGVQVTRVPFLFAVSKGFVMPSFITQAASLVTRAEVIVIVLPQFEGALIALLAKLLRKRIVVWYVCEVTLPMSLVAKFVEVGLRTSHWLTLLCADAVLTLTTDFAVHTPLLRGRNNVHAIAPLIVRPHTSTSAVALLRKRISPRQYTIGFLGRIAHEKGITYLLRAIPLLRQALGDDFVVVLAGPAAVGEDSYAAEIKHLLKKYSAHIVTLGKISEEEKGALYTLLDVFVLPSINNTEAFGIVQVEAMLAGLPVVGTDLPGVRVPIRETHMGTIVAPKDSAALAAGIVDVLTNKAKYHKAHKDVAGLFETEKLVRSYERVFFASGKTA